MITLGFLFGLTAIGCAIVSLTNMLISMTFTENTRDEAWSYTKKAYIFLGLTHLFFVIGFLIDTL